MTSGFVKLNEEDNVLISLKNNGNFKRGFKYAESRLNAGKEIIKYGKVIGSLVDPVNAMELIHTHNLSENFIEKQIHNIFSKLECSAKVRESVNLFYNERAESYGTRKNIVVVSSVSCVNRLVEQVTRTFEASCDPHMKVIPVTHNTGCGLVVDGEDHDRLVRTLKGYSANSNTFHMIMIGLGCEDNQTDAFSKDGISVYNVQDIGETELLNKVREEICHKLKSLRLLKPTRRSLSDVIFALQCGGSDAFSAITANPLLGYATTSLVLNRSKVILAETTEVRGFEKQLLDLCKNERDRIKLKEIFKRWDEEKIGLSNPAPGNYSGGLSNYLEKSIGSVLKFGFNHIDQVLDFGEKIRPEAKMCFMDSPGYDPCSITGQIASGATCVLFTTGRGSNYRNSMLPIIKIASNTELARRHKDFIDVDAESLLENFAIYESVERLLAEVARVINQGERGFIHSDFVPWLRQGVN